MATENCGSCHGMALRIKELEEERSELRKLIRCTHSTLMAHRSSWVREVATKTLGRMEFLAAKGPA